MITRNKNAVEWSENHSRAAKAIIKYHFVGDWLDSVDTEEEATTLAKDIYILCPPYPLPFFQLNLCFYLPYSVFWNICSTALRTITAKQSFELCAESKVTSLSARKLRKAVLVRNLNLGGRTFKFKIECYLQNFNVYYFYFQYIPDKSKN